jgi:hypothetical protein
VKVDRWRLVVFILAAAFVFGFFRSYNAMEPSAPELTLARPVAALFVVMLTQVRGGVCRRPPVRIAFAARIFEGMAAPRHRHGRRIPS